MSLLTSNGQLSPEARAAYEEALAAPRKDPRSMDSASRLARIGLYQEMMLKGIEVPEEHLSYAIELITVDRTERVNAAKNDRKAAKAVTRIPTAEEL